jgi:hypothetical protein
MPRAAQCLLTGGPGGPAGGRPSAAAYAGLVPAGVRMKPATARPASRNWRRSRHTAGSPRRCAAWQRVAHTCTQMGLRCAASGAENGRGRLGSAKWACIFAGRASADGGPDWALWSTRLQAGWAEWPAVPKAHRTPAAKVRRPPRAARRPHAGHSTASITPPAANRQTGLASAGRSGAIATDRPRSGAHTAQHPLPGRALGPRESLEPPRQPLPGLPSAPRGS